MDIPPITPFMVICAIIIGSISAFLAYKRGRNPYLWFVLGFIFGIFGIFAILFASSKKKPEVPQRREPIFSIHGPKDKFWYYLDPANHQQGPVSHDALTIAWKSGKIDPSTYIWHEEMTDWQPLKNTIKAEI